MLIGRKEEISQLKQAYHSEYSEFVAVYGRRRIGKTFLIRETFENIFSFQYTGIFGISNQDQIDEFHQSLVRQGLSAQINPPRNWFDAFRLLEDFITASKQKRKIIFLDELPWMDAPNSKFIAAFEHFWNGWASARKDILLIVCGSATSWIINKIFRNKGGLYNRVTYRLQLQPFSLAECEEFAKAKGLLQNRNMLLEGYMVMGGVPYYWSKLDPSKSMAQNINTLFLKETGVLRNEFNFIYASIFNKPEKYRKVVEALAGKKSGLTRDEIIKNSYSENNGQLSGILEDLIECGFVRKYCHTGKKLRDAIYQLVDCYTLFYYQFVNKAYNVDEEYWVKLIHTPTYNTWCGLAFERVCLLHSRQLKTALGIAGIMSNIFSWHIKGNDYHPSVQIDMLIDRADNIINVCEMKYAPDGYSMTAPALKNIETKISVLRQHIPARKFIEAVLITSNGVLRNKYSESIRHHITADQLFLP